MRLRLIALAAILAVPALAGASTMAANSIDSYQCPGLCLNENTGNSMGPDGPMSVTGTVVYATSPAPPNSGVYCATGSDANYYNWSVAQCLAFSSLTTGGMEGQYYFTSISNNPVLFSWKDPVAFVAGDGSHRAYVIVASSTSVELVFSGAVVINATVPAISLNAWHYIVLFWDGSHITIYWDGSQVGQISSAFQTRTVTSGQVNRHDGIAGLNVVGYYTQFRFLKAASNFPTVDTVSCGGGGGSSGGPWWNVFP